MALIIWWFHSQSTFKYPPNFYMYNSIITTCDFILGGGGGGGGVVGGDMKTGEELLPSPCCYCNRMSSHIC